MVEIGSLKSAAEGSGGAAKAVQGFIQDLRKRTASESTQYEVKSTGDESKRVLIQTGPAPHGISQNLPERRSSGRTVVPRDKLTYGLNWFNNWQCIRKSVGHRYPLLFFFSINLLVLLAQNFWKSKEKSMVGGI